MAATNSKGLGKGLSALMGEDYSQESDGDGSSERVAYLPVDNIMSGKYQPRRYFDDTALKELSDSIAANGVMQPILVRALSESIKGAEYEIIAGERRWRASKLAGLREIPVLIKRIEDRKALEIALIENIQRQDLTALEESEGYQQLMDGFSYTQEELSGVVGKSRSYIANSLRLLSLPEIVKSYLSDGEVTAGHARALLKADAPDELVHEVVRRGLNVRQTENLVKSGGLAVKPHSRVDSASEKTPKIVEPASSSSVVPSIPKDPDIIALEEALQEHLDMKVEIDDVEEKGHITVHYESLAQLDLILKRLGTNV